MENEKITMFGKQVEYDPSLTYGVFNSQGQYGILPVRRTLNRFDQVGDRAQFSEFLKTQVRTLREYSDRRDILTTLVAEGVLTVTDGEPPRDVRGEIQNTIDLFECISKALKG
jgi:hypothetical protein